MIRYGIWMGLLLAQLSLVASRIYHETLYPEWGQTFEVEEVLYEVVTPEQELIIFENSLFGRVLALDGIIQVTELDEYVYHEMLSHVPILAHGNVKSVLIIGGGDGGMLREVLRHQDIDRVVQVEIDSAVIEMCREYLPSISKGAFDNPRAEIVIADGALYVAETTDKFDVIIIDSTDPIGPGAALFSESFYGNCRRCLNPEGILVTQNGVPFVQQDELVQSHQFLSKHFKDTSFYVGVTPTYVGGFMTYGWASDSSEHRQVSVETLKKRVEAVEGTFRYYTPEVHQAAFALPQFILDAINREEHSIQ